MRSARRGAGASAGTLGPYVQRSSLLQLRCLLRAVRVRPVAQCSATQTPFFHDARPGRALTHRIAHVVVRCMQQAQLSVREPKPAEQIQKQVSCHR
jgi:hypothetical protein